MSDADASQVASLSAITVTGAVGAVVLLIVLLFTVGRTTNDTNGSAESKTKAIKKKVQPKPKTKIPHKLKKSLSSTFNHPLLVGTLKGHSDTVLGLDFSINGKYLATVSEDRTVLIWSVKEFNVHDHKSHRANIAYDHGMHVKFSPDSRAFIIDTYNGCTLQVYTMSKKEDGTLGQFALAKEFPHNGENEVVSLGIASTGKFIMVCFSDTKLKLWDIKGKLLKVLDTKQVTNHYGAVSQCARFVASSGFTADVKVWEVVFDVKSGGFKDVVRAFELTGHTAGVYTFSFNDDSSRMATVSKDKSWKFWKTDIFYKQGQDPELLYTGEFGVTSPCSIVLSHSAYSVAISQGNSVSLFNTLDGKREALFENIFSDHITGIQMDNKSHYVTVSGDRQVYVLINIAEYRSAVAHLTRELSKASGDLVRNRLEKQLSSAKSSLASVLKNVPADTAVK